jgi:hypothetical protein
MKAPGCRKPKDILTKGILSVIALALCGSAATAQIGPGPFAAFPSLDPTDGRFLGFGCAGIATFEFPVALTMAVPAGQTNFTISFFDGDTGGSDGVGKKHWDVGNRQLVYSLYADPLRQGTPLPANLIGSWKGNDPNPLIDPSHPTPLWTASAVQMPDNDWWGATITTSAEAQAPSGNYFYILQIGLDGACALAEQTEANVKIAASNPMSFLVPRFGLVAALRQFVNDGPIIYPGPTFPPPGNDFLHAPTTYDGTFQFFFRLPGGETDLRLYDGDFDHGSVALAGVPSGAPLTPCFDTDDPDTIFNYTGFPFSTAGSLPEGINTPGSPQDDSALDAFRRGEPGDPNRAGCVRYEVHDPLGTVYRNDDPSGSFEWEQFRIATPSAVDPSNSDHMASTATLPAGIWSVRVVGLDLSNLNFFYANACATRVQGTTPDAACPDLAPYLLGDTVWLDTNGNGMQDPGEPGIPDVTVNLVKAEDLSVVASVVTGDTSQPNWISCVLHNTGLDTQGLYCLGASQPGDYLLQIAPENFQPGGALYGYASTTGGESQTHTLTDDNVLTFDFGYRGTGSIGDRVWLDFNANGVQDPGEPGMNGVTVKLFDSTGNEIASTVTSGDGNYKFNNLAPGTYTVNIDSSTLSAGQTPSFDVDGTTTPNTATVTLTVDQNRTDVDFGYKGTASLGDRVWYDLNGNGVQDTGETGLNGVTVKLFDSTGNLLATTTTAGNGNYSFNNLPAGNYRVTVDPASLPAGTFATFDADGVATPNTAAITLAAGDTRTDVDFGERGSSSLGDRLWYDLNGNGVQDSGETGINGVTVQLLDSANNVIATTTTVGNGNYTFGNLLAGTYSVQVAASTLPAGLAPSFDVDGTGTPNIATVQLAPSASRADVDFGYRGTTSLGDRVWYDTNGNGIQDSGETGINGVTVQLLDSGGNVVATKTTSGDGNYLFTDLVAGTYTVRIVASSLPAGLIETYDLDGTGSQHTAAVTLTAGASRNDVDFGYRGTGSIGDRVWSDTNGNGVQDSGEAGINGATVQLLDSTGTVIATTTTSGDGNYTFRNLLAGNYTVKVVSSTLPAGVTPSYDFDGTGTANSAAVALTGGQMRTDVDFGYKPQGSGSIGDRVWYDKNGNGCQDAGETGINGVTVQLYNSSNVLVATTVTSGDGNYTFTGLAAGTYKVKIVTSTLPAGATPTFDRDGTSTANTATVTLTSGQNRTDVDFGYKGSFCLGDRVWKDTDGDGVQDSGESGISNVKVQLLDANGTVIATTTTNSSGNYSFSGLLGGNYQVRIDTTTLPSGLTPSYDLDGIATPNIAAVTLSQSRTDVDFGYKTAAAGTGTLGYWKNHPSDWPVSQITIGGVTYSKTQAINWMGTASNGDKTIDLFKQLVAAKLNVLVGNASSCINDTITAADNWLRTYKLGSNVSASSAAWTTGGPLQTTLDNYNNGLLCAPHRN